MLSLFLVVNQVSGSKSFHTSCTMPTYNVNFFHPPPIRGTMDILWSCLFTVFLCTWTAQHLNVPQQPSSQAKPTCQKRTSCGGARRKPTTAKTRLAPRNNCRRGSQQASSTSRGRPVQYTPKQRPGAPATESAPVNE